MIKIYPIAAKVKHGELNGLITAINIRNKCHSITYGVTVTYEDGRTEEKWLYDFEFTSEKEKIKLGVRL